MARINDDKIDTFGKPVNLDDVIKSELGEFGPFQLRIILLLIIPTTLSAFKQDYIFSAAAIPHRCQIPECGENTKLHTYNPEWILNAVPETKTGFSSCSRYASIDFVSNGSLDYCPSSLFNQAEVIGCENFVYAGNNTVVFEFDLGCKDWLRALSGTMSGIGILLGLPITGYISDRFGRRVSLVFNIAGLGIIGLIRAFSVNYTMFLILQLAQTVLGSSIYTSAYILAAELIGPKYRVLMSVSLSSTFPVGEMLLGGIAWLIGYWRHVALVMYIPFLFMISYYWLLPESLRWLLSKGKYLEAKNILETVARVNNKIISQKNIDTFMDSAQILPARLKTRKFGLIGTVLRTPILLRRLCTTPIWWVTATFVYYGLSINSTSLSDTMYLNYILTCAVEIPGMFAGILFLDRIGRRATISSGYFFSALCNLLFVFIPRDMSAVRLVTYLLGKFGISMVMSSLYLYTSELYPTEFRHTLLAFSSMIGRFGSITAPLTPALVQYWQLLPSVLFGGMGVLGGLLVLTQPETLGTKLPDTLAEAEILEKSDSTLNNAN